MSRPDLPDDQAQRAICRRVIKKAGAVQFRTFVVGCTPPAGMTPEDAQAVRLELNRAVAGELRQAFAGVSLDPAAPDLTIHVDLSSGSVRARTSSLHVYGRYLKENRTLPQTRWHCKECRGRGCESCGGTGRMYPTSVEEIVGRPLAAQVKARSFKLHGMGREDVDARMLGTGRPFVVELVQPRDRTLDLSDAARQINGVEGVAVTDLREVGRGVRKLVKEVEPDKTYRARVRVEEELGRLDLSQLARLAPVEIEQQTPQRVLHRRADKTRRRRIMALSAVPRGPQELDLTMTTEAGTYVKEFINGDEGRTRPCLSDVLGTSCSCVGLDVLTVHFDLDQALQLRRSLGVELPAPPQAGLENEDLPHPALGRRSV